MENMMKLIEILLHDLPKLGGWPDGVSAIYQGDDGCLFCIYYFKEARLFDGLRFDLAKNWQFDKVTKSEYEAALAASQKVE